MEMDEGSPITTSTLLFIDNSNIFISAQKHAAKLNQFIEGVQDVRCRMNARKIITKALNGRELDYGAVYVSEPKPFTVELEAAFRLAGINNIRRFRKNSKFKEKEVDTSLTADAVEQIVLERGKDDKLLILFTGDRDMKPIVEKAEFYGFKIHIWSMPTQLAAEYKKSHSCVEIFSMDKFFDEVTFTEKLYKWKDIPKERSFVLTFSSGGQVAGERAKFLGTEHDEFEKKIVDICCNLLHLPCQGRFYDDSDFVLVICTQENYTRGGEQKDVYDVNEVIRASMDENRPPELFKKMRKKCTHACLEMFNDDLVQCTGVQTFVSWKEDRGGDGVGENFETSNQYQPLTPPPPPSNNFVQNSPPKCRRRPTPSTSSSVEIVPTSSSQNDENVQMEPPPPPPPEMAPFSRTFMQLILTTLITMERNLVGRLPGRLNVPKFLQAFLFLFALSSSSATSSSGGSTNSENSSSSPPPSGSSKNGIKNVKNKKETSYDPLYGDMGNEINLEIDEESLLFDQELINCAYNEIEEGDGGGGPKNPPSKQPPPARYEVVGRMHLKRRNKSGEHCKYGFKCENYPICNYAHTRDEKTFLNQNSKPETRRLYKTIECRYFGKCGGGGGGRCKFQYKPFLCPFAHGPHELVKGVK